MLRRRQPSRSTSFALDVEEAAAMIFTPSGADRRYQMALEGRMVIERAKGLLMKRMGLDEAGAFRRLRTLTSQDG
jgi:hypothetical protein